MASNAEQIRTAAKNVAIGDTIIGTTYRPAIQVHKIEIEGTTIVERHSRKGHSNPLQSAPVISRKEVQLLRFTTYTKNGFRSFTCRANSNLRIIKGDA